MLSIKSLIKKIAAQVKVEARALWWVTGDLPGMSTLQGSAGCGFS